MQAVLVTLLVVIPTWAQSAFGSWTIDVSRSALAGERQPKSFTVRIEPHAKGEVLTVDRIEADGRGTSSSTILYLDGAPRKFEDFGCSGTQLSRTVDNHAVEIVRNCQNGLSITFTRRLATQHQELIFDIEERHSNGSRFERRWVLHKQSVAGTKQRQ